MYHESYTCSNCHRPVSKSNTRCPHCGVYFSGVRRVTPTPRASTGGKSNQKGCVGALIGAFLVICIFGAALLFKQSDKERAGKVATLAPGAAVTVLVPATAVPATMTSGPVDLGENLYERARAGEFRGRQVSLLAVGDGTDSYMRAVQTFEDETGVGVALELVDLMTVDFEERVWTDYHNGNLADIIALNDYDVFLRLGAGGVFLDARNLLGDALLLERYHPDWLKRATLATADGTLMAGLWRNFEPLRVVYYARDDFEQAGYDLPDSWDSMIALSDRIAAEGGRPWCVGLENVSRAEWLATAWLEEILLRTQPEETYREMASGDLVYDSPEMQDALQILSGIWQREDYVYLDPEASDTTWWGGIGRGLFTNPPECWMLVDSVYLGTLLAEMGTYGEGYDWFFLPSIDVEYGRPAMVWGELLAATSARPEVGALLDYFTRPQSLAPWLEDGISLSALKDTPPDAYATTYQRSLAERLGEATSLVLYESQVTDDEREAILFQLDSYIEAAVAVASGPPPVERTGNIIDLINESSISVEATGSGIDGLDLDIENLIDELLNVEIPAGTYFVASAGGEQNMVVRHSEVVQVEPNDLLSTLLDAACAEMHDDVPGDDTGFSVQRQGSDDLARLMPVLEAADVDYGVEQAAIWIVTNNADYSDLGTLVSGWGNARVILWNEAAQAMRLVDEAGLNITYYAIWYDRESIINGANPELARWLRERGQ